MGILRSESRRIPRARGMRGLRTNIAASSLRG